MKPPKLLPDMEEYLTSIGEDYPVNPKGLEDLFYKIRSCTGLEINTCKIITALFFQEMRTQLLKGNVILFQKFGSFKMNKKNFPHIKQNKVIKGKLNK